MLTAVTREVSASIQECALTYRQRETIDADLARQQHQAYERCLEALGVHIERAPEEPDLPDAVFVEDTAVIADEVAVMTSPSLPARRRELSSFASVLDSCRPLEWVGGGASVESGGCMRRGLTFVIGIRL